jgi:DNA-binding CsgD family transcriptional regulator
VDGHDPDGDGGATLTAREQEGAAPRGAGLSNEAIAGELGIGERTVHFHLTRIYDRLEVAGRGKAIAWAVRRGLDSGHKVSPPRSVGSDSCATTILLI